jgi:hypothetical protein
MNFGSFGAGFGSFGSGVGGLLPSFTNITSWLRSPTTDGKTLANSKGVDANLTGVNCLDFDGSGDRVQIDSAGGVDLTTNAVNNFGSCVITATFKQESAGTQVIHSCGSASYRLFTQNNFLKLNAAGTEIFAIELNKVYRSTITYNADGSTSSFVLENLTDGTTQTDSFSRSSGAHGGTYGFQIGARQNGLVWNGKISNVSVTNSSVGANLHLPLAEGSGSVAYDVSGSGANGAIVGATHSTLDGIESWNHEYGLTPAVTSTANDGSVDTGIRLDSSDIVLKIRFLWRGDTQDYLLGFYSATATERFLFYQSGTQMRIFTPNGDHSLASASSIQDKFVDLEITSTTATLNGATTSIDLTGLSQTGDLRLFSNNAGGANANCDIHSFSLVKDGTLVADYTAAQEGKFYDTVSNSLVSGTGTLVTNNIPALNIKTTQVATFDGVADKLTATGITGSSVITHDGTATLTAGTGEITSSAGTAYNIKVDGVLTFTMSSGIGTSTISSVNGLIGSGTVTVGSGGLDTFWGTRVADTAGSLVSADYATGNLTISNPGGFVHNGSECGVDMVTNDLTSTQLFNINNATATETFVRKDNGNIVQILDYSAPLTGDDLTRTRNYVG